MGTTSVADQLRPPRLGPRSSELSDRARQLLDQLEALFTEEGFARLTVDGIATRLRCSKRTLYEIAPSRDELVLVVLDRRLRRAGRLFREQSEALDEPLDRLKAFMSADVSHARHPSLRFSEDVARHPAARRLVASHYRYANSLLQEIVQEGIARKRFNKVHPKVVVEIVDAALARLQDPDVLAAGGLTYEGAVAELTRFLVHALDRR